MLQLGLANIVVLGEPAAEQHDGFIRRGQLQRGKLLQQGEVRRNSRSRRYQYLGTLVDRVVAEALSNLKTHTITRFEAF